MQLICPECMGQLSPAGEDKLRCSTHGGEFKLLFERDKAASAMPPNVSSGGAGGAPANRPAGMYCVQHPAVAATAQCQSCGAYICATCDFAMPGDLHFCPTCATKPSSSLGPKRRKSMIWSYVCGVICTLGFVLSMAVATRNRSASDTDNQAVGMVFMVFVFIPAVVGLGLGVGALDRRYRNPPALWGAAIWNGVIVGVFVLLCIVGLMK